MAKRRGSFMKDLSGGQKLVPHLNRWFMSDKAGQAPLQLDVPLFKEPDTAFHPSSHGVPCARTIYADMNGDLPPEPMDSGKAKTFANGHMWHSLLYRVICDGLGFADWKYVEHEHRLQRYIEPRSELVINAGPFDVPADLDDGAMWWARGAMDISRLEIPGHSEPFLLDIKTMNGWSFKQDQIPPSFRAKYEAQAKLYLDWADLDRLILLVVAMDSGYAFKEIEITRDDDQVHTIYERWDRVAEAQQEGAPPECDCSDPASCDSKDIYVEASPRNRPRSATARLGGR